MKKRKNLVVIGMLLVIGLVFGVSLEYRNLKIEQLDTQYEDNWKQTLSEREQQNIKDNNISSGNDSNNTQSGLYNDFYTLMENATTILDRSRSLQAEAKGSLQATVTKEDLKKAGVPAEGLVFMPSSSITLRDEVKFVTQKDRLGNEYSGLGFYGSLPDFAEGKIDIPNRLSVAHYFDGMQYYVGTSDDKRVEQNCDPYVDSYSPMSYDEYISTFKNDLGDIFYLLNENTVSSESIKLFKKPVTPLDTYEVQLTLTGEDLAKATANVSIQHKYLLGMASESNYHNLSLSLTYDYEGQLTKMAVRENYDTAYRIEALGFTFIVPINIQFNWTQNFKYTYKNIIPMPAFK